MHQYGFEKLSVWKNARALVKKTYLLSKNLPSDEKFGITSQIRRSAISISSNIAEGSSRYSKKDQAHFYNTAYSSTMELLSQILLILDMGYIKEEQYKEIRSSIEQVTNKINALRKSTLK